MQRDRFYKMENDDNDSDSDHGSIKKKLNFNSPERMNGSC